MSELLEHIQTNIDSIEDDIVIAEMANLKYDKTGIKNWVIFATSKYPRKRPRIKLATRGSDTRNPRKNTVIYIDTVEIDPAKDHSGAPTKIKERVLKFLRDKDNNKTLLKFWNTGEDMSTDEIAELFKEMNHY